MFWKQAGGCTDCFRTVEEILIRFCEYCDFPVKNRQSFQCSSLGNIDDFDTVQLIEGLLRNQERVDQVLIRVKKEMS